MRRTRVVRPAPPLTTFYTRELVDDLSIRWRALEAQVPPLSAVPPKDVSDLVSRLNRVRRRVERARVELERAERWMGRRWWTRVAALRRQRVAR